MLDGAEFASSVVVSLAVVLALDGTTLLPSEDGLTFDVVGLQVLDVIGLANGLDQRIHLIWELGDEDHGLEMRWDGAFGVKVTAEMRVTLQHLDAAILVKLMRIVSMVRVGSAFPGMTISITTLSSLYVAAIPGLP